MLEIIKKVLNSNNLHHAYIIKGNPQTIYPVVCNHLEDSGICSTKGNPDFIYENFVVLTVKDARDLRDRQMRTVAVNKKRFFIISFETITLEAQNSLLKVLEEPSSNTHFIFISNGLQNILPTVFSRVVYINNIFDNNNSDQLALKFLQSNYKKRGDIATKIINNYKNTNSKSEILNLIYGLMICLKQSDSIDNRFDVLKKLSELEKHVKIQGASVKNITDSLCCLLPKI